MKIIYSADYLKYNFGPNHPFLSGKRKDFINLLHTSDFKFKLVKPIKASDEDVLLTHSRMYIRKLKNMAENNGYLAADSPVTSDNLEAAYFAAGGSILASYYALKEKVAVNTLGGFHHAGKSDGSGFCLINDIAVAVCKLLQQKLINKAAVLDLDVHAGNGTQEIFYNVNNVLTISIHQDPHDFYPGDGFDWQKGEAGGLGFNYNYPLPRGTGEQDYLPILKKAVNQIKEYKPDLTFVVFGVDTYKDDALGELKLDGGSYVLICKLLKEISPKVILLGGGYSGKVVDLWYTIVTHL